jgi:hypothetical protein
VAQEAEIEAGVEHRSVRLSTGLIQFVAADDVATTVAESLALSRESTTCRDQAHAAPPAAATNGSDLGGTCRDSTM